MTIQSRINSMNTTPTLAGMTPSEWTAKSLKKKSQKKELKFETRWILINYLAHKLMRRNTSIIT
jgi:hypothetical protein